MNRQIALRDIIKAIVILKPGATMAIVQRMIWTKTPKATIGTALHCIVAQGYSRHEGLAIKGAQDSSVTPTIQRKSYWTRSRLLARCGSIWDLMILS